MNVIAAVPKELISQLVELLRHAKNSYYNSEVLYVARQSEVPAPYRDWLRATRGEITDAVYDRLEDELRRLDPSNKLLRAVGAPVVNKKSKIKLPFKMPSLDKIKTPEQAQAWLDTHPGPYLVSAKKDGVSIGVRYQNGRLQAFTRGVGDVGGDVTFMANSLRLPKLPASNIDVRGEVIVRKDVFEKLYRRVDPKDKTRFVNPRAMASGLMNTDALHPALKHADVIMYDVVAPRGVPSQQLKKLKTLRFNVVLHKVYATLTAEQLPRILSDMRARAPYEMDGLVIVQDRKNPAPTTNNPDFAIAYKDPTAYEVADVEVVNVEWRVTRTGRLFPRINITPTRVGGVTITYCSGKSGKTIEKNGIGPGARIRVQRAGDVIPDFVKTLRRVKPQMPNAQKIGAWSWNGENIDLDQAHDTSALLSIEHFFTVIGVEDFRSATIQKFVDAGYDTVPTICNMHAHEWAEIPGTNKNIERVHAQMDACLNGIEMSTLMYASGVFGRSMGSRRFAAALKAIPDLVQQRGTVAALTELIDAVPGFDEITARQLAEGIKPFRIWLRSMPSTCRPVVQKKVKLASTRLKGEYVVFTGVRDADLEAQIVANGGEVGDSTKQMTVLIAKDPTATSSKIAAARARGIKVYGLDQFRKRWKL